MGAASLIPTSPVVDSAQSAGPATDPTYLFDLAERMHAIELLSAAVGPLRLFEFIDCEPVTLDQICEGINSSTRPTLVLLTMLSAQGLLTSDKSGLYHLTEMAREYLLPDSKWSLVPCFSALTDRPSCQAILSVLRSGSPIGSPSVSSSAVESPDFDEKASKDGPGTDSSGPASSWDAGMQDEAFAEYFLNAIDSRNAYLAHALAEKLDLKGCEALLDIAGGSGIYACALAERNPQLRAVVLEQPPVDGVARRAIERRALSLQVSVLSSDMMVDPLPLGFDVHLYSNVVHDWDELTIARLFSSSFLRLEPGGRIVIHDGVLNVEADCRPVAEYSALLMSFTAGRCYAFDELRNLLHAAGFVNVSYMPTAIHRTAIQALKPFRVL